jgi:hypothetical protein
MSFHPSIERATIGYLRTDPILQAVLDWHFETDGTLDNGDRRFAELAPFMQLHELGPDAYRYLYCGTRTPPARLYGSGFARSAIGQEGVPDRDYDLALRADYFEVMKTGLPVAQTVRSRIDVWGTPFFVSYCRYVFVSEVSGKPVVNVCSRFIEPPTPLGDPARRATCRPDTPSARASDSSAAPFVPSSCTRSARRSR